MKTILRNFITTLGRFKMASALNIVGLSVAFAAFIVIMIQVYHDTSFDKVYPETGKIYRVESSRLAEGNSYSPILCRPEVEIFLAASPMIESGTIDVPYVVEQYITIDKNGTREGFMESVTLCDSGMTKVFGFRMLEGSADALKLPNKVLVPQSIAEKLFGNNSAVGEIITLENEVKEEDGKKITYEIGGVYKDFPHNSSRRNDIKRRISDTENKNNWGNSNYYAYVSLKPETNKADVENTIAEVYNKVDKPDWIGGKQYNVRLTPIEDVYYDKSIVDDMSPKGNKTTTALLFTIALLVIIIACINFVNFSTSLTPMRIKSINTQKVLGSSVSILRAALIIEAVGISIIAFLLSLLWAYLLGRTGFVSYLSAPIDLAENISIVLSSLVVSVVVGLIAGIYPSFYTTSFPPALVLKGSFAMSSNGRQLRTGLIGFQFVVSIALIIGAFFLQIQNRYILNHNNGIDIKNVAIVTLNRELAVTGKNALIDKLKSNPVIEDVAFANAKIGSGDMYMSWGRDYKDGSISFNCFPVSPNFVKVLGLQLSDGRDFEEGDDIKETGTYIFNETAANRFELNIGDRLPGANSEAEIAGVVKDFNFQSLRFGIQPMALFTFGVNAWSPLKYAYVKIKGNPYAGADHIKKSIAEIDPTYPVKIEFYDSMFNAAYQQERKTTALITTFSLLAVIISLVGVFGLVVFETQYRRKEIGIRKVMGATVNEILAMFNKNFLRIVIICFIIAVPISWYGVSKWLETFAYKTPIHWWVFVCALSVVMIITLLTVTIQSWRAANENPANTIRS